MAALCLDPLYVSAVHRVLEAMFSQVKPSALASAYALALGLNDREQLDALPSLPAGASELVQLDGKKFSSELVRHGYPKSEEWVFDTSELASRYSTDARLIDAGDSAVRSCPPASLKSLGHDDPDLYYFCRVLGDSGVQLPGLLSMPTVEPALRSAGLKDAAGFYKIDMREQARIWRELEDDFEEDVAELGKPVADGSYVGVVSFAPETDIELRELFAVLNKRYPGRWKKKSAPDDLQVELQLTAPLTISALYQAMLQIDDGRYMYETLRALPANENSFDRRFIDAEPHDWANNDTDDDVPTGEEQSSTPR